MSRARYSLRNSLATSILGLIFLLALLGCTGNEQPVPQRGVVTLDDAPLAGFTLTFISTEKKRPAMATTDEQGKFELMTLSDGDGAMRGEYKVVVNSPNSDPGPAVGVFAAPNGDSAVKKNVGPTIHPNYQNPQTTPLRQTIPAPEGLAIIKLNKGGT